jgi:prepilin-type N-terminal cleavage/methylation domain-containing protein
MKKASFTLMEILVGLVILGILTTLGIFQYQNLMEEERAKACAVNLDTLQRALDIYIMERGLLPSNLSEIPAEYLSRAYAQILQRKGAWRIKLAYFFVGWEEKGLAYAQTSPSFLLDDLAKGNLQLISCSKDATSPIKVQGERSYALNSDLVNKTAQEYKDLPDDTVLIGDCEDAALSPNLSNLAVRHKLGGEDRGMTVSKKHKVCQRSRINVTCIKEMSELY